MSSSVLSVFIPALQCTVNKSELCAVDEDEVESMVNEALSVAKVDVAERHVHTSCMHAADTGPSAVVAD